MTIRKVCKKWRHQSDFSKVLDPKQWLPLSRFLPVFLNYFTGYLQLRAILTSQYKPYTLVSALRKVFLNWVTQSTFLPPLWHPGHPVGWGIHAGLRSSVRAWAPQGRSYSVSWSNTSKNQGERLTIISQPPPHAWVSDAIRMLQFILYVVSENKNSALCVVFVVPSPHHSLFSDSLSYPSFSLLLSSYFSSPWNLLMLSKWWFISLFVYLLWLNFDASWHPLLNFLHLSIFLKYFLSAPGLVLHKVSSKVRENLCVWNFSQNCPPNFWWWYKRRILKSRCRCCISWFKIGYNV